MYYTILYTICTPYYTILYYTVLYCTVLYYTISSVGINKAGSQGLWT